MEILIVELAILLAVVLLGARGLCRIARPRTTGRRYERAKNNFFGTNGFRPPYHGRFISDYGTRHNNVLLTNYLEGAYRNQQAYFKVYGYRQPSAVFNALWLGQPYEAIAETMKPEVDEAKSA